MIASHPAVPQARVSILNPSPKRVLIVDDDAHVRSLLFEAMRLRGYQPVAAEDGKRAQKMVDKVQPGIMVLDLAMPNMNGWEFIDWLRQTERLTATKVVVLTAQEPDEAALMAKGVACVLHKPIRLQTLFDTLRSLHPLAQ